MKRLLSLTLVMLLAMTGCGAPEQARTVGAAFMAAAAAGDVAMVRSMLSPTADITAEQVVDMYRGLTDTEAFDVEKALVPNQTGAEYLVLASGLDRNGVPHAASLAVRRENGRWLIVRAGSGFTY